MKVKRKPVTLDARQWFPYTPHELVRPMPAGAWAEKLCHGCNHVVREHGYAVSTRGTLRVCPGNWVLTGQGAEVSVVRDGDFRQDFEVIDET